MALKRRIDDPELMDTAQLTPREYKSALDFLTLTADWFGGASLFTRQLESWSRSWNREEAVSFLDVGTGGGDIPLAVARWARQRGFQARIIGLELVPETAEIARQRTVEFPEISIITGDLFPFSQSGQRFDFVTASLFLHHMPGTMALEALKAFDLLAKRGIIIGDLDRSIPSLMAVTAASWVFGNRIVRHDGPLSVRRSFTPLELHDLAQLCGLRWLRASRQLWFRVSLAGERPRA